MTSNTEIQRQDLERRRSRLRDLQAFLNEQEQEFHRLRARIQAFVDRYAETLGPLHMELDALESQLYSATRYLAEALRRNGVATRQPQPPQATELPRLPQLPGGAPLPQEPAGGLVELAPPSLKTLYRRAAMRLHPDLASSERQRRQREQQMMVVNEAYAAGDRKKLEQLLLAAGEEPLKVLGGDADAVRDWLKRSEHAVQGRLRVVQAHLVLLKTHSMHQMAQSVAAAEAQQLDPLALMAERLRAQIAERRQELYIGQRLQPESNLAEAFLHRRGERAAGKAARAH